MGLSSLQSLRSSWHAMSALFIQHGTVLGLLPLQELPPEEPGNPCWGTEHQEQHKNHKKHHWNMHWAVEIPMWDSETLQIVKKTTQKCGLE